MSSISKLRVDFQNVCQASLETLDEFQTQADTYKQLLEDLQNLEMDDEAHERIRAPALEALNFHRDALIDRTKALEETVKGFFTLSASLLKADQNRLKQKL